MIDKKYFRINLIYFLAMVMVAVIFVLGYLGVITNEIVSSFFIQILVMFAIPLLLYSILVSKNAKQTFSDAGFKKISTKMVLICVALGFVLYFINSFVANVFSSIISLLGYENLSSGSVEVLNYQLLLREFVLSCILPGFCEEFLHRGIMLMSARKCGNTKLVLITSSLLFGLMHLNINQFFYACVLGFLMGFVDLMADSIFPSMIVHFMNNFLNSYFYYGQYLNWPFTKFASKITSFLTSNALLYIAIVSIAICIMFALYFILTKHLKLERNKLHATKAIEQAKQANLPIEEMQSRVDEINKVLQEKPSFVSELKGNKKFNIMSNSFLICSILLGGLVTISSFIWGVL